MGKSSKLNIEKPQHRVCHKNETHLQRVVHKCLIDEIPRSVFESHLALNCPNCSLCNSCNTLLADQGYFEWRNCIPFLNRRPASNTRPLLFGKGSVRWLHEEEEQRRDENKGETPMLLSARRRSCLSFQAASPLHQFHARSHPTRHSRLRHRRATNR